MAGARAETDPASGCSLAIWHGLLLHNDAKVVIPKPSTLSITHSWRPLAKERSPKLRGSLSLWQRRGWCCATPNRFVVDRRSKITFVGDVKGSRGEDGRAGWETGVEVMVSLDQLETC